MSKYSKHMKEKAWRNQTRQLNRERAAAMKASMKSTDPDPRSTRKTFDQWCQECGDELGEYSGVLSIAGSDGITITDTKVGKAEFCYPEDVDAELESNGYYEEVDVNMGSYHYLPPKMRYPEWFHRKYPAI